MVTDTEVEQQTDCVSDIPQLPDSLELGSLNIPHVMRLWHKAQLAKHGKLSPEIRQQEWNLDLSLIDALRLGLEPTMTALYQTSTLAEFETFVLAQNNGQIAPAALEQINLALHKAKADIHSHNRDPGPLSDAQMRHWHSQGYIVVPGILSPEECQQTLDEIEQHTGVNLQAPDTWYDTRAARQLIMVQHFYGAMQDHIRQKDSIRQVFSQLWETDQLIPATDRISVNPPETAEWTFPGPGIHWDMDHFTPPIPFRTQGLIYLTDTAENQGAFCCVPGFHHQIDDFLASLPPDTDPQVQDWSSFDVKPIAANAGDLIIWHHALPHGSSPNNAHSPRVVQYINMYPL